MELNIELGEEMSPLVLLGHQDSNIRLLEKSLGVQIFHRGRSFRVSGVESENVKTAIQILKNLGKKSSEQKVIQKNEVKMILEGLKRSRILDQKLPNAIKVSSGNRFIQFKTFQQQKYVESIFNKDVTFGIGPAGTGKTYIAVAVALNYLMMGKVKKVILTRPVVEAGENLGFLPGNLEEKINPYLRPLMDSIYDMLSPEELFAYRERGQIEVAPLAYMRGRTLNNAFIILDEAQNTSISQIKMFLTRIGYHSKVVVTGDITQKDLPNHQESGLEMTLNILKDIPDIDFTFFDKNDVVRHPIVIKIIEAFEKYEEQK